MYYKVKKISVSNYPFPVINCVVNCFMNEDDTEDKAVFWIPFKHDLSCCLDKSVEEINAMLIAEGQRLFEEKQSEGVFEAIEKGLEITAPEIL